MSGASDGSSRGQTKRLLDRARSGDASVHGDLLEHLRPRIVLWVAARLPAILRRHMTAEDVAQEVLLSVHQHLSSFRGEDRHSFHAWLFRIAENRIRDLADHHGACKRRPVRPVVAARTTPATVSIRAEAVQLVRAAVERLREEHRQVIRLRQLEELGVAEVAEIMDRSENAVRVLHCRALKALRALLSDSS